MGRNNGRKRIPPIDFSAAVSDILDEYGKEAEEALRESLLDTAVEAMHKLRSVRRFSPNGHPTGAYSASWTIDVASGNFRGKSEVNVYNENHYRLAHLLEFGHAIRSGGRVSGFTHIAPVNDWAQEEVIRRFEKELEKNE